MEPTTTQLTNRTRALANLNAGLPKNLNIQTPEVISAEDIKKENTALVIPDTPPESNPLAGLDAQINSLLSAASPEETQQNKLQESILSRMEALSGERARQQELEQQAGLPGQRQELQNIVNQLQGLQKEAAAIPLQIQQEAEGRGITAGGAAPIQAGRLRENAIKSLGLAAIGQTLQGNISLAQQSIQDALDAEFEPQRQQLQILSQLYQFNKDALERVDKKRADRLGIFINERNRLLEIEKVEKEGIYNIGLTAREYGADTATVQKIFNTKDRQEALIAAGTSLRDPEALAALENAKLENTLKKIQIQKEQKQLEILEEYGGLSPKEARELEEEKIKESRNADAAAEQFITSLNKVDAILNSKGFDSIVGPTGFSRRRVTSKGEMLPRPFPLLDEISGAADDAVALTEQLISQQFLDALVGAKAKGATFGALTKPEQDALTAAATAIGQAKLYSGKGDDKKVVAYDMSEKEFERQLNLIKESARKAYERSTGKTFTSEEEEALDETFSTEPFFSGQSFF